MPALQTNFKPLSDKDARALAKQIAKDSQGVRVKFGQTNGVNVLHVIASDPNASSRTIKTRGEWEIHPANLRAKKGSKDTTVPTDDLVISHKAAA